MFLLIPAISAGGLCEKCDPMLIGSCEGDMTCHDDFKICISKSSNFDPNSCREISSDVFNTVCPEHRCDSEREKCKLIIVDGQSTPTCVCRTRFHYSKVSRTCVTDEEDPQCTSNNNCGQNQKCDLETMSCVCKQGYMTDRNNPKDCVQQCGSHMTLDFDAAITEKTETCDVNDQGDGGETIVFRRRWPRFYRCRKYRRGPCPMLTECYWGRCFSWRGKRRRGIRGIRRTSGKRGRDAEENGIVEIEGSEQEDDNTVRFRPNICDPDATCMPLSLFNSARVINHCECNEGFTGDGVRCYDAERCQDYCNEHIPGSSCHGHDDANWSCKCPPESILVGDDNGDKQCVVRPTCSEGCPEHSFCDGEDDRCQCQAHTKWVETGDVTLEHTITNYMTPKKKQNINSAYLYKTAVTLSYVRKTHTVTTTGNGNPSVYVTTDLLAPTAATVEKKVQLVFSDHVGQKVKLGLILIFWLIMESNVAMKV